MLLNDVRRLHARGAYVSNLGQNDIFVTETGRLVLLSPIADRGRGGRGRPVTLGAVELSSYASLVANMAVGQDAPHLSLVEMHGRLVAADPMHQTTKTMAYLFHTYRVVRCLEACRLTLPVAMQLLADHELIHLYTTLERTIVPRYCEFSETAALKYVRFIVKDFAETPQPLHMRGREQDWSFVRDAKWWTEEAMSDPHGPMSPREITRSRSVPHVVAAVHDAASAGTTPRASAVTTPRVVTVVDGPPAGQSAAMTRIRHKSTAGEGDGDSSPEPSRQPPSTVVSGGRRRPELLAGSQSTLLRSYSKFSLPHETRHGWQKMLTVKQFKSMLSQMLGPIGDARLHELVQQSPFVDPDHDMDWDQFLAWWDTSDFHQMAPAPMVQRAFSMSIEGGVAEEPGEGEQDEAGAEGGSEGSVDGT